MWQILSMLCAVSVAFYLGQQVEGYRIRKSLERLATAARLDRLIENDLQQVYNSQEILDPEDPTPLFTDGLEAFRRLNPPVVRHILWLSDGTRICETPRSAMGGFVKVEVDFDAPPCVVCTIELKKYNDRLAKEHGE